MPPEKVAPTSTPRAAIDIMTLKEATFDPIAELRKFAASLVIPTTRSEAARKKRIITKIRYTSIFIQLLMVAVYTCHYFCHSVILSIPGSYRKGLYGKRLRIYHKYIKLKAHYRVKFLLQFICPGYKTDFYHGKISE